MAAPAGLKSRATDINLVVLQFALTLEHLENVFYKDALKNFTVSDFEAAGYSADYYNNIMYIAFDEQTHVEALSAAITGLGATPVAAGTYAFPVTDVPTFVYVSQILENVGVSAYTGAATLITDPYYLTVAATILDIEAIHTSYQRASEGLIPMANPFETPLDPTSVFTLASQFITSLPASNYQLPFTAFPYLTADGAPATCEEPDCSAPSVYIRGQPTSYKKKKTGPHHYGSSAPAPPAAGATVSFTAVSAIPSGSYLAFVNGLAIISVSADIQGTGISGAVPAGLGGQTYVYVLSSNITGNFSAFDDSAVLFGPAAIEVMPAAPTIDYSVL